MDKGDNDVCGGHRSRFSLPGRFLRFLRLRSDLTRARFFKFFSNCACAVQSSDHFRRAKPHPQRNSDLQFFFQAECVWGRLRADFPVGSELRPDSALRIKMVKKSNDDQETIVNCHKNPPGSLTSFRKGNLPSLPGLAYSRATAMWLTLNCLLKWPSKPVSSRATRDGQ